MDKKSNMKQAMFDVFGVGTAPAAGAAEQKQEKTKSKPAVEKKAPATASFLSCDTVLEGTLHSNGDVEIAGEFKGDITVKGKVVLRSVVQGNISANSLDLEGCTLVGDVVVCEAVTVSRDSTVRGNVTAKEIRCAGQITGDLKIAESTSLEESAQINGNIATCFISVVKGAEIHGGIEIKSAPAPKTENK